MATLYVTEYATLGGPPFGPVQSPMEPPIAAYTVAIGGASVVPASVFNSNTTLVRLHADAICSFAFGRSPTAAATSNRMAANQTEYHSVPPGQGFTVAVITNT